LFCDIKNQSDEGIWGEVLVASDLITSPEIRSGTADKYRPHSFSQLYGWVEEDEILGICEYQVHKNHVEIINMAAKKEKNHPDIGGQMISALWGKYQTVIKARTDDDGVEFFREHGFAVSLNSQSVLERWECVLNAPKPLDQITDEERARLFPIILREYNPLWAIWFEEEKENLFRFIGRKDIVRISHIGSTSVPGLMAKPIVDILFEIKVDTDIDKLIDSLKAPEYICLNPPSIPSEPPHLMFIKGYTPTGFAEKVYHIHVRYPGDWDEVSFRDYLITHPQTAAEYAALKTELYHKYKFDRDGYTLAKGAFIREVLQKEGKK
jgi:GrpB-like predicted nucleotidyltransferase (UPF0157 family)